MASDLENKNPWITKDSKIVYENPWIKVRHNDVLNPSGKLGIYGSVSFKNVAVGILAIDEEGYTYIVGQYRYAIDAYSWEIPEGGCPLDKDPLDAAKRELKEETGIIANKWTELQRIHTSNSVTDELAIIYIAEKLEFGESEPEECELLKVKKLYLSEAISWVEDGIITDAISVTAIYAFHSRKNKRGW